MNYGKKKAIIIAIVVTILIITVGLVGVILYINTDLFKSNQALFFKYIGQVYEDTKFIENKQLKDVEKHNTQLIVA